MAVDSYGQRTSTRVMFHGPTHGSATGALPLLAAALEQFAGRDLPARQ